MTKIFFKFEGKRYENNAMCIIKKILKYTEEKYFSHFFVAVGFFMVFYISQFFQSIFFSILHLFETHAL